MSESHVISLSIGTGRIARVEPMLQPMLPPRGQTVVYRIDDHKKHLICMPKQDFVGRIAQIARSCHGETVMLRVLERYLVLCAVKWHESGVGHGLVPLR